MIILIKFTNNNNKYINYKLKSNKFKSLYLRFNLVFLETFFFNQQFVMIIFFYTKHDFYFITCNLKIKVQY